MAQGLECALLDTIGILGQVWYLIVSIPDLCTLTYFDSRPSGRGFEPYRRHCVVVLEQDTFILA